MARILIRIDEFVTGHNGITPDEGEPIFSKIEDALKLGKKVEIDFSGVIMVTTAFLNVVIGKLYKDYTSEQLKALLSFANLQPSSAVRIKKVTENAKLFYKDEKRYNDIVERAANGDN